MAKGTVNKTILMGNIGEKPVLRKTQSGVSVCNISVATTELGPKNPNGQRGPDVTSWHRCTLWGFNADNAAQYLDKGSKVYLEGRITYSEYVKEDGTKVPQSKIDVMEMQFVGGKSTDQGGQQPAQQQPQQQQGYQNQQYQQNQPVKQQNKPQQTPPQPAQMGGFEDFDDDIPF